MSSHARNDVRASHMAHGEIEKCTSDRTLCQLSITGTMVLSALGSAHG